jgi:hypothetical protein
MFRGIFGSVMHRQHNRGVETFARSPGLPAASRRQFLPHDTNVLTRHRFDACPWIVTASQSDARLASTS